MAIATYSTGTVSVANGATVIVGSSTIWSRVNAMSGDDLVIAGQTVIIKDVTDPTHLLIDPWPYASVAAGTPYEIIQRSPLRFAGGQVAQDVSNLVAALNASGFYFFVAPTLTAPDPSLGEDGQYARQESSGKVWLKTGGVWVFQGTVALVQIPPVPYASGTTFGINAVVSYKGKLWLSFASGNTGNPPDTSPTWWSLFLAGGDAYDLVNFDTDRPSDGEMVFKMKFTKTVTFYAGLIDSQADAGVGATSAAIYSYRKNGMQFATLTFGAGGQAGEQAGVFSSAADTIFSPGDIFTIIAPSPRDPTLSNISHTIAGYRS